MKHDFKGHQLNNVLHGYYKKRYMPGWMQALFVLAAVAVALLVSLNCDDIVIWWMS